MTKSIYTFGKDRLEVDVSSWLDKYSIRLNDKEIRKGKIEARNCRSHIHEINIGDRIFRIRFIVDKFGIMSPIVEPTIDTFKFEQRNPNGGGTNIGFWMIVILLVIIIMVLPIIPKESCIQILGHNVSCTTKHVSIIQLILNR